MKPNEPKTTPTWEEWAHHVLINIEGLTKGLSALESDIQAKKEIDAKELRELYEKLNDIKSDLTDRVVQLEKSFEVMKVRLILFSGFAGAGLMFLLDWILDKT